MSSSILNTSAHKPSWRRSSDTMSDDGTAPTTDAQRNMLDKALDLLAAVSADSGGRQAAELASDTDIPLSTAYRLLSALSHRGYTEFDKRTRRYTLGLETFVLAQAVAQSRGLTGVARPVLEDLAATTGEATLMAVRRGSHQLYIHYVRGPHSVSVMGSPGTLGPLHCAAQGKVLVAMEDEKTRNELVDTLELTALTARSITDRDAFRREITAVHEQGWAVADEEHEAGIRAIAVPIMGSSHHAARAAISIAAPAFRATVSTLHGWLPEIQDAARRISLLMPLE